MPSVPGSTFSAGIRTSSRASPEVTEARREYFQGMGKASKPGVPFSTRKPRMPPSVCAQITATSAISPLVIHILLPLST